MLATDAVEQDGGRPALSEMMTDSEAPMQLDDDEDEEEEDKDGARVVVADGFSPTDAH